MKVEECGPRCPHWSKGIDLDDGDYEPICLRRHVFAFTVKKCSMIRRKAEDLGGAPAEDMERWRRGWDPITQKGPE
jgi:hypothetical protein